MHNDALHAPLAIGGGIVIYGWTLQELVLALWAAYVAILIATKLPDLIAKYPIIKRIWRSIWRRK